MSVYTLENRADLIASMEEWSKPRSAWRIGTEHEKFCFRVSDYSPVFYEGSEGIGAFLERLGVFFEWNFIRESNKIVGLSSPEDGFNISLEPGGQFEISSPPLNTLHQICSEMAYFSQRIDVIGNEFGIDFLGLGFSPKWTCPETPVMPKSRYEIMTRYMPKVGQKGLDMMYRSCTTQVNLDFSCEADMVRKLRVALALQSVATALFANSPFTDGEPNHFLSFRADVWRYTDAQRTGLLPFVFEEGMGFERYVDYALDVPMYFVVRDGQYIDVSGESFRFFLSGMLTALPSQKPTMDDWYMHLSTLFPDVRLKHFLEMRGADSGSLKRVSSLSAFWVGLLYDSDVLDAAWEMVKDWTMDELLNLRDTVPRLGLATPFRGSLLQEIAMSVVTLAREGLSRRSYLNERNEDETIFLECLEQTARSGQTPANILLNRFFGSWNQDITHVFKDKSY
ncbi:MAG: glutamate--cysteine ligase [Alphaproteobacteria bacterium]|nr:glutamate--cysteine ligase [Alphaproteobacteria bacterium]